MDGLTAVLRTLRLKSALLSRAELRGRWAVKTTGTPGRMLFHGVAAGECFVKRDGDAAARHLIAGDVVVLTHGDGHTIASERDVQDEPLRITDLPVRRDGGTPIVHYGTLGAETRLVCGTFALEHPAESCMTELLPALLVGKPQSEARRRWSCAAVALIEQELGYASVSAHATSLADSLFVAALSDETASATARPSSLLAAARDDRIGRALALVHGDPSKDWSSAKLAAEVSMSRTRFFERFTKLVGESPARYVARWRSQVAADLLQNKQMSTTEIAELVGYADEDALAKAFKRHMRMSPAEYRRKAAN